MSFPRFVMYANIYFSLIDYFDFAERKVFAHYMVSTGVFPQLLILYLLQRICCPWVYSCKKATKTPFIPQPLPHHPPGGPLNLPHENCPPTHP